MPTGFGTAFEACFLTGHVLKCCAQTISVSGGISSVMPSWPLSLSLSLLFYLGCLASSHPRPSGWFFMGLFFCIFGRFSVRWCLFEVWVHCRLVWGPPHLILLPKICAFQETLLFSPNQQANIDSDLSFQRKNQKKRPNPRIKIKDQTQCQHANMSTKQMGRMEGTPPLQK